MGFQVLPKRWIIARTFAWLDHNRRLSKGYEQLPSFDIGSDMLVPPPRYLFSIALKMLDASCEIGEQRSDQHRWSLL